MPCFIDRTGVVYGELTVLSCTQRASRNPRKQTRWLCECSCGFITDYQSSNLTSGNSSCCMRCRGENAVIHGNARRGVKKSNTYNSWHSMKSRCDNVLCDHYENYGGRGICYTEEWGSFEIFLRDMGDCPEGLTLERVDVNGGYNKNNCKWATRAEQSYNRRINPKNISGVEGVNLRKDTGKWAVYIDKEGTRYRLGCYDSKEDAILVRREAEVALYGKIKEN